MIPIPLGQTPDWDRMSNLCIDPSKEPCTRYEQLNKIACEWYVTKDDSKLLIDTHDLTKDLLPEKFDFHLNQGTGRQSFLFYTGGKDSFVAGQLLKAAGVQYKTVGFSFVENHFLDKVDISIPLGIIKEIDKDWSVRKKYGKNIPIHYFMFLLVAGMFPNSDIYVGNEYLSVYNKIKLMYVPYQTDILLRDFNESNNGTGVNGCKFYSPCSNIPEFHVYRLARVLGFNRAFSEGDMYEKKFRYDMYEALMNLLKLGGYFQYTMDGIVNFNAGVDLIVNNYAIDTSEYVKVFIEEFLTSYQPHGQNFTCTIRRL